MNVENTLLQIWLEKYSRFRTEAVQELELLYKEAVHESRFEVAPSKGDGFIQRELPL